MEKKEEVDRRRGGKTIKEWTGMDFARSTRATEDRLRWNRVIVK